MARKQLCSGPNGCGAMYDPKTNEGHVGGCFHNSAPSGKEASRRINQSVQVDEGKKRTAKTAHERDMRNLAGKLRPRGYKIPPGMTTTTETRKNGKQTIIVEVFVEDPQWWVRFGLDSEP